MFDKFGEFDSVEELNNAAAGLKAQGDEKAILDLALENGLDQEDAQDYADGIVEELATSAMAAVGKLKIEARELDLKSILTKWMDTVTELCLEDEKMRRAVRKKGKSLKVCMSELLKFSFENKEKISDEIVKVTKVNHNGKIEPMKGPVYLGFPDKKQEKQIITKYYME